MTHTDCIIQERVELAEFVNGLKNIRLDCAYDMELDFDAELLCSKYITITLPLVDEDGNVESFQFDLRVADHMRAKPSPVNSNAVIFDTAENITLAEIKAALLKIDENWEVASAVFFDNGSDELDLKKWALS